MLQGDRNDRDDDCFEEADNESLFEKNESLVENNNKTIFSVSLAPLRLLLFDQLKSETGRLLISLALFSSLPFQVPLISLDDSQIDSFLPNSSPTLLSWNFSNLNANDMDTGSIRKDAKTKGLLDSDPARGKSNI